MTVREVAVLAMETEEAECAARASSRGLGVGDCEGVRGARPFARAVRGVAVCVEEDESDIAGDGVRMGVELPDSEGEVTSGSAVWTCADDAASMRNWRRE